MREELGTRQVLAQSMLHKESAGHAYGLHRWLPLPPGCDRYRLVLLAHDQGLDMAPSYAFAVTDAPANAVRISVSGAADRAVLNLAIGKLSALL